MLLIAAFVLFYRYRYRRILRDRANLRISRDRAHLDLQMMAHQVQKVQTQAAGSTASSKSRLPSLPPGPPSSAASGSNIVPPLAWEQADREQHKATHPKSMKAGGRQWLFAKSIGVKRARAGLVAPARLAPAMSSGPQQVELAELAELAEITDDEALHPIVVRHLMPTQGIIPFDRLQGRYLAD